MAEEALSRYVGHLPAVFQEDPFLGRFLLAFERILSGLPGASDPPHFPTVPPGLGQLLDRIQIFFDPKEAPPDFLPWLAGWIATSLREDWDVATRRRFLTNVVPLYRRRGTLHAMRRLLQLYLNPDADAAREAALDIEILEAPKPGEDDSQPFPARYFQVRFSVKDGDSEVLARRAAVATAIIDREKPAHTFYGLRIRFPSLQIDDFAKYDGVHIPTSGVFVGINTTLGEGLFESH